MDLVKLVVYVLEDESIIFARICLTHPPSPFSLTGEIKREAVISQSVISHVHY